MKVKSSGFKEANKRLKWAASHFEEIRMYILKSCVERVLEQVQIRDVEAFKSYIHRIRVPIGGGEYLYGISVEPKTEMVKLSEMKDCVLFVALENEEISGYGKLLQGEPWLPEYVPSNIKEGDGYFLRREASEQERELVGAANRRAIGKMQPLHVDTEIPYQEDWRYSLLRAEFGLGDKPGTPKWGPALQELFGSYAQEILDDVADIIASGNVDEISGEYEDRSPDWYEQHAAKMVGIMT